MQTIIPRWTGYDLAEQDPPMLFVDLDGDGVDELVVTPDGEVLIFFWSGDHYEPPFIEFEGSTRGGPTSEFVFKDWTGDDIPEVIFTNVTLDGGSDYNVWVTTLRIIHCAEKNCSVVANNIIEDYEELVLTDSVDAYYTKIRQFEEPDGTLGFSISHNGFWLDWGLRYPFADEIGLRGQVITSTLATFVWDGGMFILRDQEIVALSRPIKPNPILQAVNSNGETAAVSSERINSEYPDRLDYGCHLKLEGFVSEAFACRPDATVVTWQDVNADGKEDVIVKTIANIYDTLSGGFESKKPFCLYQNLIAYQWIDHKATKIADVSGCVIQEDFFGVKLDDMDGDGVPEIRAAEEYSPFRKNCENIYKWDGSRFVYWSDLHCK